MTRLRLLSLTADTFPPNRPDVETLFLKEFAERQREEKASEGVGNPTMFEALKRAKLVE